MTETIPVRVQHKRMSASDWASSTLVLLDKVTVEKQDQ